jgi:hypothetical protein
MTVSIFYGIRTSLWGNEWKFPRKHRERCELVAVTHAASTVVWVSPWFPKARRNNSRFSSQCLQCKAPVTAESLGAYKTSSLYECCRRLGRTGSWKQGRMRPQYTQPQQFRHSTPETGQIASETGYPAGLCETASVPWANLQGLLGCLLWGQHWSSPGVGKLSLEILRIKLCYTAPEQVPHCDECHCQREVLKTLNEATGRPPATSSLQFEIGWWVPLHTSIRQLSIEGIETAPRATTSPFQTACVGLTL